MGEADYANAQAGQVPRVRDVESLGEKMSKLLIGDVREVVPTLESESVQMCVTSPPYWGLRDYGVDGQLGLETTPEEYVANMVAVFREVGRLLKGDGSLWLNLGDSYSRNTAKGGSGPNGKHDSIPDYGNARRVMSETRGSSDGGVGRADRANTRNGAAGLKEKDLIGIPWRLAFALQADGWYLRQDIIWHKPNPMPESVTDRCTKAHEYLFLLSKSPRYYFDAEAIKESAVGDIPGNRTHKGKTAYEMGDEKMRTKIGLTEIGAVDFRNKRSVWTVSSQPYAEAHFATFPQKLIEPCILAGSRPGDVVLDPFFGSGTTGEVCERLGRQWLGVELSPEYAEMAARRTAQRGLGI